MNTAALKQQHIALTLYLQAKLDAKDWHAVSDAANDLRVLEKEIEVLSNYQVSLNLGEGKFVAHTGQFSHPIRGPVATTEEPNERSGSKTSGCGNKGGTK